MVKKKNKPNKAPKLPGKGTLNQKHEIFKDKRTKRKRTRQTQEDNAVDTSKGEE